MDEGQMPLFDDVKKQEVTVQASAPHDTTPDAEPIGREKTDDTKSLTYTQWMDWEDAERIHLGLPDGYAIPAPPGLLEMMTGANSDIEVEFDFSAWQIIWDGDDVCVVPCDDPEMVTPEVEEAEVADMPDEKILEIMVAHQGECLILPCPWDDNILDQILCKQAQIERAQQDDKLDVMRDFITNCLKGFIIVEVPGFMWELQYLVPKHPEAKETILLRADLSPTRRLALICVLLDLITNPDEFYTLSGIPA